eukprot:c15248_g1_i1 orf=179-1222(+)
MLSPSPYILCITGASVCLQHRRLCSGSAAAMPWPKRSTIPKFGNWDKNEETSYSIIFDKVRAEKERILHTSEGDPEDTSLDQSFCENGNVGGAKKTSHSIFSDKAREDRGAILLTSQEDKRYTPQHLNVLKNSGVIAGREISHASYDKSWGLLARASENSSPKSSLGGRIIGEQQQSSTLQADPWGLPGAPLYNPSGAPSRQPMQIGATKENSFFNERQCVDREDKEYQGRLHAIPTNVPRLGRHMYEINPAAAKLRSSLQSSETSKKADMQGKPVLPKFGNWGSADGFTEAFSRVQNERRLKHTPKPTVRPSSPFRPDEDLYGTSEGSSKRKNRRGWLPILCCSKP